MLHWTRLQLLHYILCIESALEILRNLKIKIVESLQVVMNPADPPSADRASLGIVEDYPLGEPTLEQVFLKFAKQQEASDQEQERSS